MLRNPPCKKAGRCESASLFLFVHLSWWGWFREEGGVGVGLNGWMRQTVQATVRAAPQRAGWRLRSRSSHCHVLWVWLRETGEIAVVCIVMCSFGIHNAAAAGLVDKCWRRFFCTAWRCVMPEGRSAGAVSCVRLPDRAWLYVFTGLLRPSWPSFSCVFASILIRAPQLHQALRVQVLR